MGLCATSTVGVAAVGYSLGRPQALQNSPPPSRKERSPVERLQQDGSMNDDPSPSSPGERVDTPWTPHRVTTPSTHGTHGADGGRQGGGLTGSRPRSSGRARRKPSADVTGPNQQQSSRVRENVAADAEGSRSGMNDPASSPQNAWLRRLSSRDPSPLSSPGPNTPSLTFSNGSAAPFLRDGLGVESSPLPPNKLVKRTASAHTPSRKASMPIVGRTSKVPTLRRPATSHQRSATIQQHPAGGAQDHGKHASDVLDQAAATPASQPDHFLPNEGSDRWQFYFEPKPTKLVKESPQHSIRDTRPTRSGDAGAKRIQPDARNQPTLIKSSSLSPTSQVDAFVAFSLDDDNSDTFIFGGSRPETPSGLDTAFRTADVPSSSEGFEQRPSSRRSFSISDMIGTSRSSWMHRTPSSRVKQHGQANRTSAVRYTSMPTLSADHRNLDPSQGGRKSSRRNITDPAIFHGHEYSPKADRPDTMSSPPLPPLSRLSSFNLDPTRRLSSPPVSRSGTPLRETESYLLHQSPRDSPPLTERNRQNRVSLVSPSDRGSTLVGSDNEFEGSPLGVDDEDVDFQSETVFDSLRTRATSSSSGVLGPRIETIFDESPPQKTLSKGNEITLQNLASHGGVKRSHVDRREEIPEESESNSTPKKRHGPPSKEILIRPFKGKSDHYEDVTPSPHEIPLPISPTRLGWNEQETRIVNPPWLIADDDEDDDWDRDEEIEVANRLSSPQSLRTYPQRSSTADNALPKSSPDDQESNRFADRDTLRNIFQWSEQPSHESLAQDETDARPRTVHGKQLSESRNRTSGRRRPSALQVRRQSISVVADPKSQFDSDPPISRFATWGFGSKGPSEDWNEDFEFDVGGGQGGSEAGTEEHLTDGAFAMKVPQAIKERQASVIGHLCHIKEFALLVEDLKRLRVLGSSKGIINGSSKHLWKEADGIIDLASLEDENEGFVQSQSRSPQGPSPRDSSNTLRRQAQSPPSVGLAGSQEPSHAQSLSFAEVGSDSSAEGVEQNQSPVENRRKSILSLDDDIFGGSAAIQPSQNGSTESSSRFSTPSKQTAASGDDGQNSSAVARSVIEIMHQRRTISDPLLPTEISGPHHKTQFDTTTLRDLVAHVSVLSRKLAELVRHAEETPNGKSHSPQLSPAPSLSQILADSVATSPSFGNGRLPRTKSSNAVLNGGLKSKDNEMGGQLPMMTVI
ncbi:MAG: hypothetical protein M1837_005722 [Sclerophora amabilis]|nr:MAG: hypothetical protein M1837_005722 [Sclerophora amabilis]